MKEWSILAIKNLLENNVENQKLIHNLSSRGQVKNDILKEFENGVMRIDKN